MQWLLIKWCSSKRQAGGAALWCGTPAARDAAALQPRPAQAPQCHAARLQDGGAHDLHQGAAPVQRQRQAVRLHRVDLIEGPGGQAGVH